MAGFLNTAQAQDRQEGIDRGREWHRGKDQRRGHACRGVRTFRYRGFLHRCFLYLPKVGYRYPFLRVVQDGPDYPVTVVADPFPQGSPAANEAELRMVLGLVFQSNGVKNVVLQLLDLLS